MDAPTYPPAREYRQPIVVAGRADVDSVSVRELLDAAPTRAILIEVAPGILAAAAGALAPHLGNFTLKGIKEDGVITVDEYEQIASRLRALPASLVFP